MTCEAAGWFAGAGSAGASSSRSSARRRNDRWGRNVRTAPVALILRSSDRAADQNPMSGNVRLQFWTGCARKSIRHVFRPTDRRTLDRCVSQSPNHGALFLKGRTPLGNMRWTPPSWKINRCKRQKTPITPKNRVISQRLVYAEAIGLIGSATRAIVALPLKGLAFGGSKAAVRFCRRWRAGKIP